MDLQFRKAGYLNLSRIFCFLFQDKVKHNRNNKRHRNNQHIFTPIAATPIAGQANNCHHNRVYNQQNRHQHI
jgi:hypothetical protein